MLQFEEPERQAAAVNSSDTAPEPSSVPAAMEPEGAGAVMDPSGVVSLPTPVIQQLQSPAIARQQVDSLLAVLAEERRKRRIRRRWIIGVLLAWIGLILVLAIFLKDFTSLNSLGW